MKKIPMVLTVLAISANSALALASPSPRASVAGNLWALMPSWAWLTILIVAVAGGIIVGVALRRKHGGSMIDHMPGGRHYKSPRSG